MGSGRHIPRCFVDQPLEAGQPVALDRQQIRHLTRVLRLGSGDRLTVFNGSGGEYEAELYATADTIEVKVLTHLTPERESPLHISLIQCVSRGERMDYSIGKAVELGVNRIQPVISKRCVVKLDDKRASKRQQHWQAISQSAAEQSGREIVPPINALMTYADWLRTQSAADAALNIVLDPLSEVGLAKLVTDQTAPVTQIKVIIGPEGGLDNEEIEQARNHGYVGIRIGPRILRTETAGPALIALAQGLCGDMRD